MKKEREKESNPTGAMGTVVAFEHRLWARWLIATARRVTWGRPHLLLVGGMIAVFTGAYLCAWLLRFDFQFPEQYATFAFAVLPFVLFIKILTYYANRVFRILWPYTGLKDLFQIFRATAFASGGLALANLLFLPDALIPRSVLVLDGILTFLAVGGLYALLRVFRESSDRADGASDRVFIVGAGDAGEGLLREFQRNPSAGVKVVGFLDDAARKSKCSIHGVPVFGGIREADRLARQHGVLKAFIAIPSADGATVKKIAQHLLDANLAIKILPPHGKLSTASGYLPQLREITIEDLLRREPIKLDDKAIASFVHGKTVLVTGAAGSIGSELCRQILEYHPAHLVALDNAETPLHTLMLELASRTKDELVSFELGDVTDRARVEVLFNAHRPQVVFHAAALKHVPMLEFHPREAVRVNVGGTRLVAEIARDQGVEAFVLISTDKAVNPSSVMGATKRLAEMMLQGMSAGVGRTRYMSVRFGNVLGSNGSVLPIFREQLTRGGPLTVTHPEMRRYFMTIPEAVQLVVQASVLGKGGEVFILHMGEPVRIVDLAEDLIRLSGFTPHVDIKIEFTGVRPGEKLFEELQLDSEVVVQTAHPQVFCLRADMVSGLDQQTLTRLEHALAEETSSDAILSELKSLVPEFEVMGATRGKA